MIVFEVYNTNKRRVALFHAKERAVNYVNQTNKKYKILERVIDNHKKVCYNNNINSTETVNKKFKK